MTFTLTYEWWYTPLAITALLVFWALCVIEQRCIRFRKANRMALLQAIVASTYVWLIAEGLQ